jgi:capsular polysaccharide biosynthesis protein
MTFWQIARTVSIGIGVIGVGVVIFASAWILWQELLDDRLEKLQRDIKRELEL